MTISVLKVETTSLSKNCKYTLQHLGEIDVYNERVEPEPEIKRGTARLRRNSAHFLAQLGKKFEKFIKV